MAMLSDVLTKELVNPDLDAETKIEVIDRLLDMLCATGQVKDREQARRDVLANEQRSSTGMQHGIAIPHAKTAAVDRLLACVGVTRRPIDFETLDGKPARIFAMTLSPPDQTGPHMRFLADIGRMLKHRKARRAVLSARSASELLSAFTGHEPNKSDNTSTNATRNTTPK